jgi:hypothetical protein
LDSHIVYVYVSYRKQGLFVTGPSLGLLWQPAQKSDSASLDFFDNGTDLVLVLTAKQAFITIAYLWDINF